MSSLVTSKPKHLRSQNHKKHIFTLTTMSCEYCGLPLKHHLTRHDPIITSFSFSNKKIYNSEGTSPPATARAGVRPKKQ